MSAVFIMATVSLALIVGSLLLAIMSAKFDGASFEWVLPLLAAGLIFAGAVAWHVWT